MLRLRTSATAHFNEHAPRHGFDPFTTPSLRGEAGSQNAMRTQHKIRLAGIDAPERRQAFGNVSKQNLSRMVFNKEVTVDWDK
jgi:endonuclease YncB( thermonuclease family)